MHDHVVLETEENSEEGAYSMSTVLYENKLIAHPNEQCRM